MSKGGRRKGLSKEQPGRSDRSVDSSASQVLQSADQASDESSEGCEATGATSGIPVVGQGGSADALGTFTDRKQAEAALAAAHRQIQSIIDNTPAIVYALDLEERFMMANVALAKVLNSTPEQLIGKRRHEFMPKEDADWHEANDRRVIAAGKALEIEEHSQLPNRSITWLTTKFPLRDAQGKIYAVAGISADITERKTAEEALRASNEELDHFNRTMVDRELRMIELKQEINALLVKQGMAPKYEVAGE